MDLVWVEEQEAAGPDGRARLLGRFTARHERGDAPRAEVARVGDRAVDEAIVWARRRAGLVLVRFGRRTEYWSAGPTPHWSYPVWPPHDLPPLIERLAVDADWQEQPPGEPVHWAVTFWLTPDDLGRADRDRWNEEVAACAATAGLGWDGDCLTEYLADVLRGRAERDDGIFSTLWPPAYRIFAVELADGAASAERRAAGRVVLPDGYARRTTVRPADLSE